MVNSVDDMMARYKEGGGEVERLRLGEMLEMVEYEPQFTMGTELKFKRCYTSAREAERS